MKPDAKEGFIHELLQWRIVPAEACSELGWVIEESRFESRGVRGLLRPYDAQRHGGGKRRVAVLGKRINTMETTGDMQKTDTSGKRNGILYPLLLIAAIAVIIFSILGIATMMGVVPSVSSKNEPAEKSEPPARTEPAARASDPHGAPTVARSASSVNCPDCGVVESIRAVEVKGEASGLGAVAGGVIGGILGNQVGGGRGRTATTVIGAGAGAYAGHEIEKNVNKSVRYQVRVRMNDGTYRTVYERSQPALVAGQKVRVRNNHVVAAG